MTIEVKKTRQIIRRIDTIELAEDEIREAVIAYVRANTKGLKDYKLTCEVEYDTRGMTARVDGVTEPQP